MKRIFLPLLGLLLPGFCLMGCGDDSVWNNPHPLADYGKNIRYGSFDESPKTLDPAQSFSADENLFIAQIYEPPLQYHYLKRPYTLMPLTAASMPVVRYWDAQGNPLTDHATTAIAYTTYDITLKPGIYYQPHPAFAKDSSGEYRYWHLTRQQLAKIGSLQDFPDTGTRELVAADYVYEIKRLAHPALNSPILGTMSAHILGMSDYANQLRQQLKKPGDFLDLRQFPLSGAQVIDKYTYRITLLGQYRQFHYWLAMPFFAPIPWEVDYFYAQPGLRQKNITFDWYPIGTGAYQLTENNPNRQMVLTRNPYFHPEYYPTEGEPGDAAAGYLLHKGARLPMVDQYVFSLEKEAIPRWNKFLQGYYDQSAISSDNYTAAIQTQSQGQLRLSPLLAQKNIRLSTSVQPAVYSYAFNMLDPVVGGSSDRARKLRQAISLAIDESEFIQIFMNGRGVPAHGPIPPGIFGYDLEMGSRVVPASTQGSSSQGCESFPALEAGSRQCQDVPRIVVAKQLLAQAGYPGGRNSQTGQPLVLHYNTMATSPGDKDQLDWLSKQFAKLGIELMVETTDYNRFMDKLRQGDVQIFPVGWQADYPDPENFLMLFYGPNGEVKYGGVNAANYQNAAYDALFQKMKNLPNEEERSTIMANMLQILQEDSPWVWGVYSKEFVLAHAWLSPIKPSSVITNSLKYQYLDPQMRKAAIIAWNQPILWPLAVIALVLICLLIPVIWVYWQKVHRPV